MTDEILMQTLKKHGLERFDPSGQKFDPNVHDAAFMTKMEGKEDGTVFETIQKGFSLNGRVVRVSRRPRVALDRESVLMGIVGGESRRSQE